MTHATIRIPWSRGSYADWELKMLDCHAEIFDCCDIHSEREWADYVIWSPGKKWARGSAGTVAEAQELVVEHIVGRWNARAASVA